MDSKVQRRLKIKKKIRGIVKGTIERPRLTVFRSNKAIYAQLVDDLSGVTIASISSFKNKALAKVNKVEASKAVGKEIAKVAIDKGIKAVCFDRNGYLYHGRVKSLAEGAREGGLEF